MFSNIGGKIKKLASVTCWILIIASVIGGLAMIITGADMYGGEGFILGGVIILIVGPLVAWVSSFVLYGFGQLVQNSDKVVVLMGGEIEEAPASSPIKNIGAMFEAANAEAPAKEKPVYVLSVELPACEGKCGININGSCIGEYTGGKKLDMKLKSNCKLSVTIGGSTSNEIDVVANGDVSVKATLDENGVCSLA